MAPTRLRVFRPGEAGYRSTMRKTIASIHGQTAKALPKHRLGPSAGAALLATLSLAGCGSFLGETTGDVAGVAGAGVASAVTKDATVAAAIGLGAASVAHAGLLYAERR